MYVLDTNTLSYFFRGEGRVAERLSKVSPADVVIPTIVLFEIEATVAKSSEAAKRRAQLEEAMSTIRLLPFGAKEAMIVELFWAGLSSASTSCGA